MIFKTKIWKIIVVKLWKLVFENFPRFARKSIHISMFFFKVTFCVKKPPKSCYFDNFVNIIASRVIVSRPHNFCHLRMCSPEVLDWVRYQKQLLASINQKYFCTRSCPADARVGSRMGPNFDDFRPREVPRYDFWTHPVSWSGVRETAPSRKIFLFSRS